jgi:hypothetical protein
MNEYLKQFIEDLKKEYPEPEWEYNVDEKLRYLTMKNWSMGEFTEIYVEWNEYNVPIKVIITETNDNEEIITPYSCHDCAYDECPYYDKEKEECSITDEDIDKEEREWEKKLYESAKITIARTIVEEKCYLDIPHTHIYKAYTIALNESVTVETIKALIELFDRLIEIAEKTNK